MQSRLTGKVVLITGASAGIGAACTREFAKHGSNLILTARRIDRLNDLKASILTDHPSLKIHLVQLDIQSNADIKSSIAALPKEFTPIHVLVNNAGLVKGVDTILNLKPEDLDVMFDTNVKGLLYMTQAVLPQMIEHNAGGGAYCASKHAVDALTRTLRIELIQTKINVTCINPGFVETEFSLVRFYGDKEVYEGFEGMTGEDVAESVVFAASRRENVCIASLDVMPTCQAYIGHIHKAGVPK